MRDRTRLSLLCAVTLLASACSDDDKRDAIEDDGGLVTGERDSGAADGSIDGGTTPDIDATVLPDGQVVLPDGALPDATLPDGALPDAALVDAATADAAQADAGSSDASDPCQVNDPKYGCGTLSGNSWISFPDFEVDLVNKVAWSKPVTVVDDDELAALCPTLAAGGLSWELPQMEDVRKLAAGCSKTVPGGSCQVYVNEVLTANAGDCDCADQAGMGPNNGRYCRAEVPECDTLWVWTHTFETGDYAHWFYDVTTGSIIPEYVQVGIALTAKGRCVHDLADGELPAFSAP